jgi:hypothetical protein
VQEFKKSCIEAYKSKAKLRNLLKVYEGPKQVDSAKTVKPLREYRRLIDKEDLTGGWQDTRLARICGENMGRRETRYYSWSIEKELFEKGTIGNFEELKERIKNESARLRQKGFNPQVVLIPWDYRYERALTDVPRWKRSCPLEGTPIPKWVTSIDGMEVFIWPHQDSECVGIVDIGAFIRFTDNKKRQESFLNIHFRNIEGNELNQFLVSEASTRERREFKRWLRAFEYDMTKVSEMKRIVAIEDTFRLEIITQSAGAKLFPSEETMGIVYREGEKIYHLPECKLAQQIPVEARRYFRNLGLAKLNKEFKPCENCHKIILRYF